MARRVVMRGVGSTQGAPLRPMPSAARISHRVAMGITCSEGIVRGGARSCRRIRSPVLGIPDLALELQVADVDGRVLDRVHNAFRHSPTEGLRAAALVDPN